MGRKARKGLCANCLPGVMLLLLINALGCGTTMAITPQVAIRDVKGYQVMGKILYDGNPDYLPRTVANGNPGESPLSFQFSYQCAYGSDNTSQLLPLFNPLSIVGFPIGANTLVITGKLDVFKDDALIKSYTSTCLMDKTRNLFYEGETYSELRKRGLIEARNNIESQMYEDKDFFVNLVAVK